MNLVWHAEGLVEVDWLRYIFGDIVDVEVTDLNCLCLDDNSIHVVSSTWAPMSKYETYFQSCREHCKHIVLVHLSDEWFSGNYDLYSTSTW